ncbi:MAG: PfkB family carbohydrate kinase [Enterobacteriaceae bacterium]
MSDVFQPEVPVLVLGGAVGDLLLRLPRLPERGEDIAAREGERQICGCAFNVARALMRLQVSVINGLPVGNGPWGQAVETAMEQWQMEILLRHPQRDNGWCLALIEPDGERTFITVTGCEAEWSAQGLAQLPLPARALIYANGYEVAEAGGGCLARVVTGTA